MKSHPNTIIDKLSYKWPGITRLHVGLEGDRSEDVAPDARTRVRQRIRALLEKRGKTNRAFAGWMGHKDQWASNLLAGRFSLSLDELDRAASFLNVPPSDLVKLDDQSVELSPSERRVVEAMRTLPVPVRDHLMLLADYLVGVTPREVDFLATVRRLSAADQKRIFDYAAMTALVRSPEPDPVDLIGPPETSGQPASPTQHTRKRHRG